MPLFDAAGCQVFNGLVESIHDGNFFPCGHLPNQPAAPGLPFRNYQFAQKTPVDKNTITQRVDFNESSKSQWFGRFSYNEESTLAVLPALGLNDGNTLYTKASQGVLSNVRTISSTKVNEARFGYNSLFNNITQQLAGAEDVSGLIGIPVKVTAPIATPRAISTKARP